MSIPVPILDSHIHLFPASELPNLAWNAPGHPLWHPHTPAEYRRATAPASDLLAGYVFLETDRRVDESAADENAGWEHPLREVGYLARIAAGRPAPGEEQASHKAGGDGDDDVRLCRGIVPWAPVAAGEAALGRYLDAARATCEREGDGAVWGRRVRGFRYLLQDKPDGTMLGADFVAGVRLLGRRGFAFDVGVDTHRRGRQQLEECVGLVERAHEGLPTEEKVVFILSEFDLVDFRGGGFLFSFFFLLSCP